MASTKKPADSPKEQPAQEPTKAEAAGPSAPPAKAAPAPAAASPTKPEASAALPPTPPAPTSAVYRVWVHGALHRDGRTYNPGDTLALPCAVGDKIVCLERV